MSCNVGHRVNPLLFSTLPKNQADGDKWLVTEIIGSTLIWSPSMKNFYSTKHFLFLAVVAMETGFKDFVETGQNFSERKLKIGSFHIDSWDSNTCHINRLPLQSKELLKHFLYYMKQTPYPICFLLLSNRNDTIETHFINCQNWPFSKRINS